MYWGLDHGPKNIWPDLEKISCKLKGVGYIKEKMKLAPKWPKMELQSDETDWHLSLGPRNVWCKFEKDQLKTLWVYSATRNKQIWPPNGSTRR